MRAIACSLLCLGMGWAARCGAQQPGELDTTFAQNGILWIDTVAGTPNLMNMGEQNDGKVVICLHRSGGLNPNSVLLRLNLDGSLDQTFGSNGALAIDSLIVSDLVVQDDDKIILMGKGPTTGGPIGVRRFQSDGGLDVDYGVNGEVVIPVPGASPVGWDAELQQDGRLLVCGSYYNTSWFTDGFICRLDASGDLDNSFAQAGLKFYVSTSANYPKPVKQIEERSDGNLVVASPVLTLLHVDGSPVPFPQSDISIGGTTAPFALSNIDHRASYYQYVWQYQALYMGVRVGSGYFHSGTSHQYQLFWEDSHNQTGWEGQVGAIIADQSERFLFAGSYDHHYPGSWYLWRTRPDGEMDSTFGAAGEVATELSALGTVEVRDAIALSNGQMIVAGFGSAGGTAAYVLARYHNIPDPRAKLDLKLFLGGPMDMNTGLMHDSLRAQGLLPLQQPYLDSTFQSVNGVGPGMTAASVLSETGAEAAVDWVWLELLDAADTATVVATRTGLLRRDGKVTSPINHDPIDFSVGAGSYFLRVRHRNHLGVTLSDPIALSDSAVSVDLSDPATSTFGTEAQKEVNGVRMLWPGDVNHDGLIRYAGSANDRDAVLVTIGGSPPTVTSIGYKNADANMDGIVKYAGVDNDRDVILQSIGGGYPTVVRFEQRP